MGHPWYPSTTGSPDASCLPPPRVDCRSNVVGSVLSLYLGTFGTSFFSVTCTTLIVANFPARKARTNRFLPKRKARTNRVLHRTTSGAVAVPGHVTTLSSSPTSTHVRIRAKVQINSKDQG